MSKVSHTVAAYHCFNFFFIFSYGYHSIPRSEAMFQKAMKMEKKRRSRSRSSSHSSTSKSLSQPQARPTFDNIVAHVPLKRLFGKTLVGLYVALVLWLIWHLMSLSGLRSSNQEWVPSQGEKDIESYFGNFEGYSECGIRAVQLYSAPSKDARGFYPHGTFCKSRRHLLMALSEGGRIGFDAPYEPRDCNYRWLSTREICNVFTRFDSFVFIGDDSLSPIYAGLNTLLRQDLATGGLNTESMKPELQAECHCSNQYIKQDCRDHFLKDSEKLSTKDGSSRSTSSYLCDRPQHAFLHLSSPKLDKDSLIKFHTLVPAAPKSAYRPIPIVVSLSPSQYTASQASAFLISILNLADATERNTPILWIGPTAAGHIEIRGRKGNQEIWDFDRRMAQVATENDIEVLGMWNLTVQTNSWDGLRFGQEVSLVQAMMVVNWFSRLESS